MTKNHKYPVCTSITCNACLYREDIEKFFLRRALREERQCGARHCRVVCSNVARVDAEHQSTRALQRGVEREAP